MKFIKLTYATAVGHVHVNMEAVSRMCWDSYDRRTRIYGYDNHTITIVTETPEAILKLIQENEHA